MIGAFFILAIRLAGQEFYLIHTREFYISVGLDQERLEHVSVRVMREMNRKPVEIPKDKLAFSHRLQCVGWLSRYV